MATHLVAGRREQPLASRSSPYPVDQPAIRIDGLTKRFGSFTAVDSLSFSVPVGSIFGFLGPNGSGKTTTLGMVLGIVPIDGGSASIFGHDVQHDLAAALRRTGALLEKAAFYPYLSGRQNLSLLARVAGIASREAVDDVLETVSLTQRADAKFGGYSTGMKQRLGIAAALLKQPDLVVLDEPTSGLDPAGQREIRALISDIAGEGRTVILSSHMLHEVQEICSHIAIIDHGKLVASGALSDILTTENVVEVAVDRPAEAAGIVRAMPEVQGVTLSDHRMVIEIPADRVAALNRVLVHAGFDVTELRPRQSQLEERFLALTEEFEQGAEHDNVT
jgi:ABC-2 type transport system ATP-binding protein